MLSHSLVTCGYVEGARTSNNKGESITNSDRIIALLEASRILTALGIVIKQMASNEQFHYFQGK